MFADRSEGVVWRPLHDPKRDAEVRHEVGVQFRCFADLRTCK